MIYVPGKLKLRKQTVSADPYYNNVSLLLHGNGTDGSTTIVDSSLSNKAAVITGDIKISTVQSKFGGASIAFDGNNDAIDFADSLDFYLPADFTIEAFVYSNSWAGSGGFVYLFGQYQTQDYAPVVGYLVNGVPGVSASADNSTFILASTPSGGALSLNTWHHVAWVRYGDRWSIYVNGTERLASASAIGVPYNSTGAFRIGRSSQSTFSEYPFNGYLDEFRITKGIARYQSAFTPPTAPFPEVLG